MCPPLRRANKWFRYCNLNGLENFLQGFAGPFWQLVTTVIFLIKVCLRSPKMSHPFFGHYRLPRWKSFWSRNGNSEQKSWQGKVVKSSWRRNGWPTKKQGKACIEGDIEALENRIVEIEEEMQANEFRLWKPCLQRSWMKRMKPYLKNSERYRYLIWDGRKSSNGAVSHLDYCFFA